MDPRPALPIRPLFALWLLAAVALLLAGCATPVGVRPLDRADTNRRLTENVLANESLSAPTQQLLNRAGITLEEVNMLRGIAKSVDQSATAGKALSKANNAAES